MMDHDRVFHTLYSLIIETPNDWGAIRYWNRWCRNDSYKANEFERYLEDHPLSKALEKRVRIREVIRKLES